MKVKSTKITIVTKDKKTIALTIEEARELVNVINTVLEDTPQVTVYPTYPYPYPNRPYWTYYGSGGDCCITHTTGDVATTYLGSTNTGEEK